MHPVRKQNCLAGFDYSQPGAYFVTLCAKERKCILSTVVGADAHIGPYVALSPIGEVAEKYLRTIPGIGEYVIMPNHIHMILRISAANVLQGPMWASAPTGTDISSLVRSFKTLVSKELGQSIWQRSFYEHIIRDERDYLIRVQYIQENPAKWYYDDYYVP